MPTLRGTVWGYMDDISTSAAPSSPRSPRTRPARRLLPASVAVVSLAVAVLLPACSKKDQTGTPLPEATLVDLQTEEPASLPEGTPLVVNFWASWCTPCRKEMPAFQAVADAAGDQVAIVGITDEDDREASREAAADAGATYPLYVDVDQSLLTDLEISGLPGTVFVDEDGDVIGRHLGALTEDELVKEIEDRYGITV